MFMGIWTAITTNPVARKAAIIFAVVVAAIFGYEVWKMNVVAGVRRQEREKRIRDAMKETARLTAQSKEITNDLETRAKAADVAVAHLPEFQSLRVLREHRPDLANIVFGDDPEGHVG